MSISGHLGEVGASRSISGLDSIIAEWANATPYRDFKDTAGNHMFIISAEEWSLLLSRLRSGIPRRQAWLNARTAYIGELAAEGKEDYQIADAVDLDDLQQVRLLMMTAQERGA